MSSVDPNTALTPADRARLARLLGMIGSAHDNEALNAARLANRLVRDRRMQWADVLNVPTATDPLADWRAAAAACVRSPPGILTTWERDFARSLVSFPRCTDKQLGVLRRLFDKVMLGEAVA
jgi:hypothetical protein